jgi:hypothetical protein
VIIRDVPENPSIARAVWSDGTPICSAGRTEQPLAQHIRKNIIQKKTEARNFLLFSSLVAAGYCRRHEGF